MSTDHRETLVGSMAVEGEPVFDNKFHLVSYTLGDAGLTAMEVAIDHDGRVFTLEIGTPGAYLERSQLDLAGPEAQSSDESPYVIGREEIMPSDVAAIKGTAIEDLMPHLVEQVKDI